MVPVPAAMRVVYESMSMLRAYIFSGAVARMCIRILKNRKRRMVGQQLPWRMVGQSLLLT